MSSLRSQYARYGLMASLVLILIDALEKRTDVVPQGEDAERLDRLKQLLAASYLGGVAPSDRDNFQIMEKAAGRSRHSSVDESVIVKSVLPRDADLKEFVPKANGLLDHLTKSGLTDLDTANRKFFDVEFKPFLHRLADSNQIVITSRRTSLRDRRSLI